MTIINKGIFDTADVFLRQTGNDWPTAQVLSTSDITEGVNLYFTNARVNAAVSGNLALKANVSDLTTANVSELTNLYYTNARVLSYVSSLLTTSNVAEGSNLYYTNTRVVSAVLPYLTSSNVAEGSNLYYTNTRVVSAILPYLTTSNVSEGSNLYYTNTRVISAVLPYLTTSNVSEGSNLYYTNARVYSNVIALLPTLAGSGIQIQANGQINANASATSGFATSSNVANTVLSLSNFTTANLVEGTNLYYTNARVSSNIIGLLPSLAGSGILIQANGQINANVSTVLITNSDVIPVTQGNTAYTLSRVVTDPKAILVINEGLIQIPTTDYTVSGTTLTTTTQYPVGSNIEVRYFGTVSSQYSPTLSSLVNNFTGDGSNVNYTLSSSPVSSAYTIVNVDGVFQLVNTYSVNGSILSFTEAPAVGANIEIRVLSGTVTSSTSTSSTSTSTNSRILGYNLVFGG